MKFAHWTASLTAIGCLSSLVTFGAAGLAQTPSTGTQSGSSYSDPTSLVRKAVKNETGANSGTMRFMFCGVKTTPKGSTRKIYVETREGTAGMAVEYDGKPLSAQQSKDEQARMERIANNPEELRKKRSQERDDTERTLRILRALPDAFLYEYAGEVRGTDDVGHRGDPLVRLTFRPNSNYRPPSRVEEVLTGMRGDLLLDAVHYRIASIDGTLFKEVGFGWGILGHLDRGGHFLVHQEAVENNFWEISRMTLKFTGKILLLKSLTIDSTEVFSAFKPVPLDMTYAQAVELLKKEVAEMAKASAVAGCAQK